MLRLLPRGELSRSLCQARWIGVVGGGSAAGRSTRFAETQREYRVEVGRVPVAGHVALGKADVGGCDELRRAAWVQDLDARLWSRLGADEVLLGAVVEDQVELATAHAAQYERHELLGEGGESVVGGGAQSEVSSFGGG